MSQPAWCDLNAKVDTLNMHDICLNPKFRKLLLLQDSLIWKVLDLKIEYKKLSKEPKQLVTNF